MARRNNATASLQDMDTGAPKNAEELLTVHEVANRLRVDDTTVRRWINNGILDAVALPHSGKRRGYRIKKSTLDVLLASPSLPA